MIMHFAEGKRIWQLLQHSNWWWVTPAVFLQLLFLFNQSALYKASYRLAGLSEKFGHLFKLLLAASFTAVAIPGGTLSGVGVMVFDAARRGLNTARVVMANLIFFLSESGLMDLLFVRIIEYFREQGYDTFNMGLCPLAGVGNHAESGVPEKILNLFYHHFNQLYAFKGLRQFKEKFGPRWEPRYLIYTSSFLLPKIALAVVTADAGGNLFSAYIGAWWEKRRQLKN